MRRTQSGFTLIELMIVVAIIGILAAIAIPNYLRFVLRARQAEAMTIMGIIKNQQFSYQATHDCFAATADNPGFAGVGSVPQVWSRAPLGGPPWCGADVSFERADVTPTNALVLFSYECDTGGANLQDVTCSAYGDLDGDGIPSEYIWCHDGDDDGTTLVSPRGSPCAFPGELYRVSPGQF